MSTQKFSSGEAVRFGWATMKGNLGFFIILLILAGVVRIVPDIIGELAKNDFPIITSVMSIVSWILQIVIALGFIRVSLGFCDNKNGVLGDLFSDFPLFFKYFFASILYMMIVLGGFILLIIPGIIWAIRFQFFGYFIVDKNLGPIDALKKSFALTKGSGLDLFLFGIVLGVINLLGTLCLLIGLFAAIPTTMVASAFVYRKLLSYPQATS